MERNHREEHYVARVGWLRAAVLGANDGIVSTASLIVGVAAASGRSEVLLAGMAGLAAGALSMAAGEYVSVSSQSDTEAADITRERAEIAADPMEELRALAGIYEDRGVPPELARQVAEALHACALDCPLLQLGLPDSFVEHGDPVRLMALQGLDAHGIQASIRQRFAALLKPLACVA